MIPARMLALAALCLLSACAALAPPQSLDERLAYAYGAHTATMNAAATALEFGDLTADQGQAVLEIADRAALVLDAAQRAYATGDPATAEERLAFALGILAEVQAYLRRAAQ